MFDFNQARKEMVDCQIRTADVTNYSILKALSKISREKFVPDEIASIAYVGTSIPLGNDRYLLEPRIFAKMLELLRVNSNDLVLDIGCGLGYSSAILSEMAQVVIALEEEFFFKSAQKLLSDTSVDNAVIYEGKLSNGINYEEKVDALIIQGGVEVIPRKIQDQIKIGGRIVAIFVDGFKGECRLGVKKINEIDWNYGFDAYVPLIKDFSIKKNFIF